MTKLGRHRQSIAMRGVIIITRHAVPTRRQRRRQGWQMMGIEEMKGKWKRECYRGSIG